MPAKHITQNRSVIALHVNNAPRTQGCTLRAGILIHSSRVFRSHPWKLIFPQERDFFAQPIFAGKFSDRFLS